MSTYSNLQILIGGIIPVHFIMFTHTNKLPFESLNSIRASAEARDRVTLITSPPPDFLLFSKNSSSVSLSVVSLIPLTMRVLSSFPASKRKIEIPHLVH